MIPGPELERISVEPPRRVDLLPGLRLSQSVSRRALLLPAALIVFFALFPLMIVSQEPDAMLALRATLTVPGRVERVEPDRGCRDGGVEIAYSFETPDGVAWKGRDRACPPSPYARVRAGDSIPVVHLEADPSVSGIPGQREKRAGFLVPFLMFPLFALALFAPFFLPRLLQLRRDRKLFRTGSLARGRVTFVKSQRDGQWPGWPPFASAEVFVALRLAAGEEREVRAACTNDWLLAHLPPGAEVHVCVQGARGVLLENYLR